MSSASSNQSVVCDGVDYKEVYPSGHVNQESQVKIKVLLPPPCPQQNEDMEMAETIEISDDGEEPTLRSIIGANGLREFIMLPEWTVNNFVSTIKETHFKTIRANYQIPENIAIHLFYKSEKCYYDGVEGVGIYEQILKAGLRFPLNTFHRELLKCLDLSVNQVSLNAWRIFIAMEILYGAMTDGARSLTVREFLHCYCPDKIDKSRGVYSFVPRSPLLKVIYETPDLNRDWKSRYFFLEGDSWMCRPRDTEYMPVDMYPYALVLVYFVLLLSVQSN